MTSFGPEMDDPQTIRIVAAVVVNDAGDTLLVRKQGTVAFMQPGGKVQGGENSLLTLQREILEELGCAVESTSCRSLGVFSAPAANEPGWTVEAELFAATLIGDVQPSAEIEEAIWFDPDAGSNIELAPLTRAHALPLARGLKRRDKWVQQ
ncbi:MAG: NUDIX domain-containing protein [Pseudomonadota bacterium]|nr:NUDIX domain-containing protein [Pseudomonadota bacterium]